MIKTNCHICNKEIHKSKKDFMSSKSGFHFCGNSCAAKYNNTIYKVKNTNKQHCLNCGLELIKKYRGETHCSMLCKSERMMKTTTIEQSSKRTDAAKYVNIRSAARSYSKYFLKPQCYKCGYDKHYEVCHIKDISSFSKESTIFEVNQIGNLVHLCPNCHWEFDNICSDKQLFLSK